MTWPGVIYSSSVEFGKYLDKDELTSFVRKIRKEKTTELMGGLEKKLKSKGRGKGSELF